MPETIISYPKICRVSDIFRPENKTKVSAVMEFVSAPLIRSGHGRASVMFTRG